MSGFFLLIFNMISQTEDIKESIVSSLKELLNADINVVRVLSFDVPKRNIADEWSVRYV